MADQGDAAAQLLDLAREDLAAARAQEAAEEISASKSGSMPSRLSRSR